MAKVLAAAVLVLTLWAFGTAHASSIVTNGDFTPVPSAGYVTYFCGQPMIGWTVTDGAANAGSGTGSVDLIGTWFGSSPPGGGGSVDLDGSSFGGITQTLVTVPNQTYNVTFNLSGNTNGAPSPKVLQVSFGGSSYTVSTANNAYNGQYTFETIQFTATGASTVLSFTSMDTTGGYNGPVIGNVAVSAVPVPPSILLLAPGLLGLVGMRKRFKA